MQYIHLDAGQASTKCLDIIATLKNWESWCNSNKTKKLEVELTNPNFMMHAFLVLKVCIIIAVTDIVGVIWKWTNKMHEFL